MKSIRTINKLGSSFLIDENDLGTDIYYEKLAQKLAMHLNAYIKAQKYFVYYKTTQTGVGLEKKKILLEVYSFYSLDEAKIAACYESGSISILDLTGEKEIQEKDLIDFFKSV